MRSLRVSTGILFAAAALVAGCGGGDDDGGTGAGGGNEQTADAKKLDPAQAKPTGDVQVCIGKDTSGIHTELTKRFNRENPEAKARLVELPESADEQRTQMVQRLRAKSPECDLLALDVIWTAEFAAQGWLQDASDVIGQRRDEFIESTLGTAEYDGKHWAVPYNSNAGFLYFRTDQVNEAPESWEDVYEQAAQNDGLVYQGARYEGLTVNFLELLYSAGGKVLSDDGAQSEVDSDQAREVLQFMVDGIDEKSVPKAVTTYKEEEARRAFESEKATFMRNWPYAFTLGQKAKIEGNFDITTFPSYGGSEGAGVLGGYNLAVSSYTDNVEGSLALIGFLTGEEAQIESGKVATPPVIASAYDDPGVQKAMPFATKLRDAIEQAQARPVSPVYPQISEAIYKNVHDALSGQASVDEAVKAMDEEIARSLETF